MKKLLLPFLTAIILSVTAIPSSALTLDISAGVYTWFTWWEFPEDRYETAEIDPNFLYGPALSLTFNDFISISSVFLYGNFEGDGKDYTDVILYGGNVLAYTYDVNRYDSDTALTVKLNNYFKVYAGLKYSSYTYELTASSTVYTADFEHAVLGPAAGLTLTLPVVGNFFIICNAGGFYLWGREEYTDSTGADEKFDVSAYGFNTGVTLAYFIEPISTTIGLGGRYQYIKIEYDDGFGNTSIFYGITLSAMYTFSI